MRNVLKNMMRVRFHTTSNCAPKNKLYSKVTKFAGAIGIDLALIFGMNDFFFVRFLVFKI